MLDNVAALLQKRYAEIIWIRLGAADRDPGGLLLTLFGALARRVPATTTSPGEAAGRWSRQGEWGRAYRLLGETLGVVTAQPAIVVLEGAEHLEQDGSATLDLVASDLLPALRDDLDVLLVSFAEWDRRHLGPHAQVLGPRQLRLDPRAAGLVAETLRIDVSAAALRRGFAVTGGAAGAWRAALLAGAVVGRDVFDSVVAGASSCFDLLSGLGRSLLAHTGEYAQAALAGAMRLGVWHPDLGTVLGHGAARWDEPWWLELAEGWRQLVPTWRAPLRSLGVATALDPASLTLLADHLASHGIADRALDLYMEAGETGRAVDLAVGLAGELAHAGCWPTMTRLGQDLAGRSPHIPDVVPGPARARWWCRLPGFQPSGKASGAAGRAHQAVAATSARPLAPQSVLRPTKQVIRPARAGAVPGAPPTVTVHLLGDLQVVFGEHPIGRWVSGRGRAVFEYLVFHRHSRVRRERLMAVFWPDATPEAARNSLNVAIHGLRQSLRPAVGDYPVVVHRDRAYFIEPALQIWLDVDVFEDRLKSARQHLTGDEPAAARADLEAAIGLYQGEFLADDPYEDWAHVTREHLRLAYIDCLEHLSRLRFDDGDYNGCIEACLRLLACDNCREDAQRRLMRCYSRQGQPQLALRQYHFCVATLRAELHLPPAAATTELATRIRRREQV